MTEKHRKLYSSVLEMVEDLSENPKFVKKFKQQLADRRLVKEFVVLRCKAGLSPSELATRLGWTKKRVQNFEHANDKDLQLKDVIKYANVLGYQLNIQVAGKNSEEKP